MADLGLRYLFEAAQAGTMRAASDKLDIAVSSISRQIAQLEEEYALPLIERGRRAIRLTEAGRVAVEHYHAQLAQEETFRTRLGDLRGVRSGHVQIAVGEGFLGQSLTSLFDEFQQRFPAVRLTILTPSTAEIVSMVLEDEAHVGLIFQPPMEAKIRLRGSARQPLKVIVAPDHPLAERRGVELRDLQGHALCLAPKQFRLRQILSLAEASQRLFLEPVMTSSSIQMMRAAALSGHYATVLPSISVLAELREGSLRAVPLHDEGVEETAIGLITRSGRQLEGAPLKMLGVLERQLRQWTDDEADATDVASSTT
ncbi:LysR family transcriptional regulator [Sphingomonas phyllosphaerae]|uniref:LysR family transcriptional regulator n=1 Tax=Sphingomonas phyllosphaerae TaxID=257003 RepID=UPI002413C1F7|nr:LysR family transcriptional regulator [Sphingomonas phyllosphaerae]